MQQLKSHLRKLLSPFSFPPPSNIYAMLRNSLHSLYYADGTLLRKDSGIFPTSSSYGKLCPTVQGSVEVLVIAFQGVVRDKHFVS